jgi:hypothetical protein
MDKKVLLSTLWIFLVVNLIFNIVYTLNYAQNLTASGELVGGILLPLELLSAFSIMVELAMVMILLSRLLKYKLNRILNIVLGIVIAVLQIWGLKSEGPTFFYYFFLVVEIATCISIAWIAWKWKDSKPKLIV